MGELKNKNIRKISDRTSENPGKNPKKFDDLGKY